MNLGMWTKDAVDKGYRFRMIEEFQILGMARKAGSRVLPVDRLVRGA
jgi:hypothetical protein